MINIGKQILAAQRFNSSQLYTFKNIFHLDQKQDIEPYAMPDNLQEYNLSRVILSTKEIEQQTEQLPKYMPLIHSIGHIEYNATKAYIDTLIRFIHGVPKQWQEEFFTDLSSIAFEESLHFEMLDAIVPYGSLPVHQGLQSRISLSNDSLIGRLAIVSIVNEGRGMDTGENLVQKLLKLDLPKYAQIMKQILKDENKHVAIGLKWFKRLTTDPPREFISLMKQYDIKCTWKINSQKRRNVGFDDEWLSVFRTWSS